MLYSGLGDWATVMVQYGMGYAWGADHIMGTLGAKWDYTIVETSQILIPGIFQRL